MIALEWYKYIVKLAAYQATIIFLNIKHLLDFYVPIMKSPFVYYKAVFLGSMQHYRQIITVYKNDFIVAKRSVQ